MYKSEDILIQLDECSCDYTFPILDNGYIYLAGTKLTAYRDDKRWAIIVEVIGFNYRGGGHNGITNCLHIYGNCLTYKPGTQNENFLYPTTNSPEYETFDEDGFYINPLSQTFLIRNELSSIVHDRKQYNLAEITLEDDENINAFEFLRLLDKLYHDKLVATKSEINERIPSDLLKILELENWYHPDVTNGEVPSKNETFIQIAKVLETGNIDFYKPTHSPNTHWSNWPFGGTL